MGTKYITIPFDVERAKRISSSEEVGEIVTRDGRKARIVCWDKKDKAPIMGLIDCGEAEINGSYYNNGRSLYKFDDDKYDLFLSVPEWTTFKDGDILIDAMNMPFIYNGKRNKERGHFGCYCAIHIDVGLVFEKDGDDNWTDCIKGYANEEDRQTLIKALRKSDHPLAKEYLKRFSPNHSNSSNIGKDYKFEPFDKVLVRDDDTIWNASFFSHCNEKYDNKFITTAALNWKYCIPYNEQTKHLVGTSDNWEE